MSYQPTWKERLEDARVYIGPAIAGCIVLGVASWVVWHQFGRKPKSAATTPAAAVEDAARGKSLPAARAEAEAAEKAFRQAHEAGASEVELEKLLDAASQKLNAAMQLETEPTLEQTARRARLEEARRSLRYGSTFERSMLLEEQAAKARKAGQESETREKLREALRLQRLANTSGPPETKNPGREARLASEVAEFDVAPLRSTIEAARSLANAALTRESWADAEKALRDARAAQVDLNQRFPESRFASAPALDQIDVEIAALAPQRLAAQSTARLRAAESAATAGRTEDADKAFTEAAALQREINEKYPRSRLASTARLDEVANRRDAALAAAHFARVKEQAAEVTRLLRERKVADALGKIVTVASTLEQATQAYPRAKLADPSLRTQVDFLNLKKGELQSLQELVHPHLVRFGPSSLMLDTEVTQELYERVMNTNPSRNKSRALPVDSVAWTETQEFCQRLSWMLGMRVRVPTEVDFRVALGNGVSAMWSSDSSDGHAHEVGKSAANTLGFFDLLGNVAEWIQPVPDSGGDRGAIIGGSFIDPVDALRRVPVVPTDRRERQKHIGFRFVAE